MKSLKIPADIECGKGQNQKSKKINTYKLTLNTTRKLLTL